MDFWHKETTPGTTGTRCTIRDGSGLFVAECIASDAAMITAAPAMLAALQKALPLALEALAERATSEDDTDRENFAEYQADVEAIKAAIALATATPTGESDGAAPTVKTGAPVNDFAGHAATITAAQGYVSNPAGWNAPTPAQVAHLLSLCGISHGPVAADGEGLAMDLATYHVATYRAGESGYYRDLRPDHWEVRHDSKRYVYERPRYDGRPLYGAQEARAFIRTAWGDCGASVRISGRFPRYDVETET